MTYDESVEVATVAKYLADQAHQFTQYGGVRPNGVAMIIAGIDYSMSCPAICVYDTQKGKFSFNNTHHYFPKVYNG